MANPNKKNAKAETTEEATEKKGKRGGKSQNRGNKGDGAAKATSSANALLSSAANLSFPVAAGNPIRVIDEATIGPITFSGSKTINIPGVMRMGYLATFGKMKAWTDAANVWIRSVYTWIRHANSGHTNYDAAALGMYMLAYRSALDFLTWMTRLYGVAMGSYVPTNLYTPNTLVTAMKADYTDVVSNMAKLRYFIISYASRLNQMKVPNLPFFTEGEHLLSKIFTDCENLKASFYLFDPDGYWRMHIGATPDDTYLHVVPVAVDRSVDDIIEYGEQMINGLLNSEDFNIMSGDILKAYTSYATVAVPPEDYIVQPVYDASLLWQIHNARPAFVHPTTAHTRMNNWKIQQQLSEEDSGAVGALQSFFPVTMPDGTGSGNRELAAWALLTQGAVVDLPMEIPTAGDIALITRFITMGEFTGESHNYLEVVSTQSELLTSVCVFHTLHVASFADASPFTYNIAPILSRFDLAPMVYNMTANASAGNVTVSIGTGIMQGEVTNPTFMPKDVKERIDHAVMLGLLSTGGVRGGDTGK